MPFHTFSPTQVYLYNWQRARKSDLMSCLHLLVIKRYHIQTHLCGDYRIRCNVIPESSIFMYIHRGVSHTNTAIKTHTVYKPTVVKCGLNIKSMTKLVNNKLMNGNFYGPFTRDLSNESAQLGFELLQTKELRFYRNGNSANLLSYVCNDKKT